MANKVSIWKEIWSGKSVTRAYLNVRLAQEELIGRTIDIGGGHDADYIRFMKRQDNVVFETFDQKAGSTVDFEIDPLPATSASYDTVLFLNVMEHVFNHQHIASEVVRLVKPGGQVIGFVPFLMWYHPDFRDFFRYTHEALKLIFERAGATDVKIEPLAFGPFTAAAQMIIQSFPRLLRLPVFIPFYLLDCLFRWLRPSRVGSFALGYTFVIRK